MFIAYKLYQKACSDYTTNKKILAYTTGYMYFNASFANTNYLLPNSFYLWKT